jgi:hypothetical protein
MLTNIQWRTLIDKIRDGACTPFLGAGAAAETLPLGGAFAVDLLTEHGQDSEQGCPLPDPTNLPAVAEYITVIRSDASWVKSRMKDKIRGCRRPDFKRCGEPHGLMARLPLPIYLTTNYDDFLYTALRDENRDVQREFSRWTADHIQHKSPFDDGYRPTRQKPTVFHLHGIADDEFYQSIVVSEDDYVDFLVAMAQDLARTSGREMIPTPIRSAVKTTSLLFIGYSLRDINFRVLLRGLLGALRPSGRQLSVTVQYEGDGVDELKAYLMQYFQYSFQLSLVDSSAQDFCTELENRCRQANVIR